MDQPSDAQNVAEELQKFDRQPKGVKKISVYCPPGSDSKRADAIKFTEEGFSHEDALILSYASFGFDALEKTFGVESVLTNDVRMKERYAHGFPRIEARFARMIRQLKPPYQQATLPDVVSAEELRAQISL